MNITDLIQSYFDGDNAARLGQAVGVDATLAQKTLATGLPLQLSALAEHAEQPEGQRQVLEAVSSLPNFGSIADVLSASDGASNLQRAGELLAPALLGGKAESILNTVTGQVGGSVNGVQKILHMALPLVLSLLGRQGLNAGNIGSMLSTFKELTTLSGTNLGKVNLGTAAGVSGAAGLDGAASASAALGGSDANALLDLLKSQFSGAHADKIGAAAGFSGNAAGRAVQGALPVVLNALVNKGKTDAGAGDLLKMMTPFHSLTHDNGHLVARVLDDHAEMARIEGQGRGLLGGLFGNVDEITGRLGTALGGSGSNASRLLALLTPLILSVLSRRVGGFSPSALSGLLGSLGGNLTSLLPAGLGSLGALLGAGTLGTAAAAPVVTKVAAPPPSAPVTTPVAPVTSAPVTPPPPPVTTAVTTTENRGGFPWWLIPLLALLLLGGCWLVNRNNSNTATNTTTTTTPAASILVTNPTSDSNLPAAPFTMSGTGPANTSLSIEDQGQEVAKADIGADGKWSAEIPAPTVGEHTYSVIGGEGVRSEFKVNITDEAATTPAASNGTFAISEPAANAELPAGGFDLKGTGKAGDEVEVFEDGTSLGKVKIGDDGNWNYHVASPAAGAHNYSVKGPDGTELGTLAATVGAATGNAADCTKDYTLSVTDGSTISEPFRFGGEGKGTGYSVTVKRGDRTIGTKDIALDGACGWSYMSKPGAGAVTYEVRPMGDASADPLSTVNLTVN